MERKQKQPSEVYDYYIDGTDYFEEMEEDDDFIAGVVVTKDITTDPDLVVGSVDLVGSPARSFKVWLSAGLDKETYKITSVITTDGGRVEEYEFKLKVKEK